MNFIVDHVKELLSPITLSNLSAKPKSDLSDDDVKKFWSYFSKFPNEFAAAVAQSMPDGVEFVQYDHLSNKVTVK